MAANLNNFEVTFLGNGIESRLIVRADGLEQALKAARIKLKMRNLADFEVTGVRRQGHAHTALFERDVDLSDPFAVLFQVASAMQADLSLTLDGETPESVAFFLAAKCLEDHGYERPEAMVGEALRLEEYTAVGWRWGIDYDDDRPLLDPIRCMSDIAYELLEEWNPNGERKLTWEEEDGLRYGTHPPIDFDEGVEFADNTIAYAYLLLAGAYKFVEHKDDTLTHFAVRIAGRFMLANPTASEVIANSFRRDEPAPTWAGVPKNW